MSDVTVPAPPPLVRIPRVELIHTGTWPISTGVWTATTEDLDGAVAALDCPAVRRPGLKIGHQDSRFTDPTQDGEPLLGYVDNMAVTDDGLTLVGDFAGMPAWLAGTDDDGNSVLSSAYPDRSIEGIHDFVCQIGHTHPFVLTAVALLGVTAPGVGTLQSLQDIAALYGVAASAAGSGVPIRASMRAAPEPVKAAAMVHTGAMVALIPSDADAQRLAVDGGELADELHTTLMYLGEAVDWDDDARRSVIDAVTQVASGRGPIEVDGFGLSLFNPNGDEPCIVLTLGGDGLDDVHSAVLAAIDDGPAPEQRSPWIPHLTLSYTDDAALLADLTDRTGPISFDRLRVAFAGDHTDIPLTTSTQAAVSAGGRSTMPNPRPTKVAASVSVEDVRREYYDNAPWSHWITEVHLEPLQLLVVDDESGKRYRIPVTVTGEDTFSFGDPVEVLVRYIDKAGDTVAASTPIVYASRAESRPGKEPKATQPAEPAPEPQPEPVPAPVVDDATPPADTLAAPNPPAAEPEPNTDPNEEDPVSDLSEFRSRLGLADDADEAAVLAALDVRLQPSEPTPAPTTELVAASTPNPFADELKRVSEELATIRAEKAAVTKASVIDGAVKAGKIRPADKESWATRYDKAPDVISDVLASIAAGAAVPTGVSGYTGDADAVSDEDAAFEDIMKRLDGPSAVKGGN